MAKLFLPILAGVFVLAAAKPAETKEDYVKTRNGKIHHLVNPCNPSTNTNSISDRIIVEAYYNSQHGPLNRQSYHQANEGRHSERTKRSKGFSQWHPHKLPRDFCSHNHFQRITAIHHMKTREIRDSKNQEGGHDMPHSLEDTSITIGEKHSSFDENHQSDDHRHAKYYSRSVNASRKPLKKPPDSKFPEYWDPTNPPSKHPPPTLPARIIHQSNDSRSFHSSHDYQHSKPSHSTESKVHPNSIHVINPNHSPHSPHEANSGHGAQESQHSDPTHVVHDETQSNTVHIDNSFHNSNNEHSGHSSHHSNNGYSGSSSHPSNTTHQSKQEHSSRPAQSQYNSRIGSSSNIVNSEFSQPDHLFIPAILVNSGPPATQTHPSRYENLSHSGQPFHPAHSWDASNPEIPNHSHHSSHHGYPYNPPLADYTIHFNHTDHSNQDSLNSIDHPPEGDHPPHPNPPKHPDHPEHPDNPKHPDHPKRPNYSKYPIHASLPVNHDHPHNLNHPYNPNHPIHNNHPDSYNHPDNPNHPDHPKNPNHPHSHSNHPNHPDNTNHPHRLNHPDHPKHPDNSNHHNQPDHHNHPDHTNEYPNHSHHAEHPSHSNDPEHHGQNVNHGHSFSSVQPGYSGQNLNQQFSHSLSDQSAHPEQSLQHDIPRPSQTDNSKHTIYQYGPSNLPVFLTISDFYPHLSHSHNTGHPGNQKNIDISSQDLNPAYTDHSASSSDGVYLYSNSPISESRGYPSDHFHRIQFFHPDPNTPPKVPKPPPYPHPPTQPKTPTLAEKGPSPPLPSLPEQPYADRLSLPSLPDYHHACHPSKLEFDLSNVSKDGIPFLYSLCRNPLRKTRVPKNPKGLLDTLIKPIPPSRPAAAFPPLINSTFQPLSMPIPPSLQYFIQVPNLQQSLDFAEFPDVPDAINDDL